MKEIVTGQNMLTLDMKAGDIYPIEYDNVATITISNYSDNDVYISEESNFEFNNNVGNFLLVGSRTIQYNYFFYKNGKNTIYIKAIGNGKVSIVKTRW